MHLGRTYHQQNMRSKALRQFEAVVARDPRYAWAHYHLAAIYLDAGRFREALQALQREVEDHPDAGQARLELADLLLQLGKPKLALSQLTAVSPESRTVLAPRSPLRPGQGLSQARTTGQGHCGCPPVHPAPARQSGGSPPSGQTLPGCRGVRSGPQALESYRELKERIERFAR